MKGWHREPSRHAMAARGIETKSYVQPLRAGAEHSYGLEDPLDILRQNDNLKTVRDYCARANDEKEWISDIDLLEDGTIWINDGQFNGTVIESFLDWDPDDPSRCIGYMHSHPSADFPWFSSTDYLLAMKVHDLRSLENRRTCPWTIMGLVAEGKLQIVAIKPSKKWVARFDGLEKEYEKDLTGTHEKVLELEREMADAGELVRFPEVKI